MNKDPKVHRLKSFISIYTSKFLPVLVYSWLSLTGLTAERVFYRKFILVILAVISISDEQFEERTPLLFYFW